MGSPATTSSATLAAHAAGLTFEALPAEVRHGFRRVLLDFMTCAVAGSRMPVTAALLDYLREIDGGDQATVIGHAVRLSPPNAAFANGASTHGLDFDDGHTRGSAHPAGAICPAVLALAEHRGASGHDVVAATVAGYDVMLRILTAMHPASARRGWHNTAVGGVFGAAAAASRLLGLDAARTAHALGLAASFAGGLRQYLHDGAEVKRLHPGKAARDGILCAELARRGVTGAEDALDGADGVFRAFVDRQVNRDAMLDGLGERFEITQAYFKPYPCCRHFHAALDGAAALRAEHGFTADQIERVEVGLYAVGVHGHDHRQAPTLLAAQMSAPCAVALVLAHGEATAGMFEPETFHEPALARLVGLIDVAVDPECEALYPRRRSGTIRVFLTDGRVLERRVLDPRGEGGNPMSDAELEAKFLANCQPLLGAGACARLLDGLRGFERLDRAADFFRLLALPVGAEARHAV